MKQGIPIFNDAYISCPTKVFGYEKKHDNYLALLSKMFLEDKIALKIKKASTMKEGFEILKRYPLIGNFMAYQLVTDINYSNVVNWDECSFTVVGPGSKRGIHKCFIDLEKTKETDVIKWMYDHQEEEFKRLNINFKKIGSRNLQYIDCQNLFCEFDKYCREAFPSLKSNRKKIKKKYSVKKEKIDYNYPPKWNIKL